ncbi:glycosyltransferase family 2 protein [Tamlana sp. 62-3]|uniref:Glycosyltransferase family 2 protein n=1 Tax=Neotamlana sargassicola TaxID=2883125 RepID=A0A9X1L635_9FLAO|nr:glycosyltransferase family 2 protein [Tamlana sargassicola]MCB4807306.1 glycosyltransferase family 2 protein [Tamlana sargassicola]
MSSLNLNPVIVIVAFNRPESLTRLLESINQANYKLSKNVNLVISIDFQDSEKHDNVVEIARNFNWKYGQKEIITHTQNIGLRTHIISCGDLSLKYGSVIILEDDLIVSPNFYNFALASANAYYHDNNIAGISLYAYEYEELGWFKFYPCKKNGDTFFMQWASSWGQLWTDEQWSKFKQWYKNNPNINKLNIPDRVKNWRKSWKKFYIAYLVETNRFFVYPYESFTTLKDGGGIHAKEDSRQNFVKLNAGNDLQKFQFSRFKEEGLSYDAFFQPTNKKVFIEKLNKAVEIEFDLFGTKEIKNVKADYLLSMKKTKRLIQGYSHIFIPYEKNLELNQKGDIFNLSLKQDFFEKQRVYEKGRKLYNIRKIYSIKEMVIVVFYRTLFKLFSKILNKNLS